MTKYERCDAPNPDELWVNHMPELLRPEVTTQVIGSMLLQLRDRDIAAGAAENAVDVIGADTARTLADAIAGSMDAILSTMADSDSSSIRMSEDLYSGLAFATFSSFHAAILPQDRGEARDAVGYGWTNTITELNRDEAGLAVGRLHMSAASCDRYFEGTLDESAAWYRDSGMYVRRERSEPNLQLIAAMAERQVGTDFAELQMLTPYSRYQM